jgi:hypothetical protein
MTDADNTLTSSESVPVPERSKGAEMDETLRERREKTYRLWVREGRRYTDVVETLAAEYDVTEHAIKKDIQRMDDWLERLNRASTKSGASRIREIQHSADRYLEMAQEAREDDEMGLAAAMFDRYRDAQETLFKLDQDRGVTEREPQEFVTTHEGTVSHELTEKQQENLSKLKDWSREQTPKRDDTISVENLNEGEGEREGDGDGGGNEPNSESQRW